MKSLVSLVLIMLLLPYFSNGKRIDFKGKITIDKESRLIDVPSASVIAEGQLFLLYNEAKGLVDILNKENGYLKYIRSLGSDGGSKQSFLKPVNMDYHHQKSQLNLIDGGLKKLFVFGMTGAAEFSLYKSYNNIPIGYDIKSSEDGNTVIISGFKKDEKGDSYDLYSLDVNTDEISYLLPSFLKYNLNNYTEYYREYKEKLTLPGIGTKAYIDVCGDHVFLVWQGLLKVAKINLKAPKEKPVTFGHRTDNYMQPDGKRLGELRKIDPYKAFAKRKNYSYITDIFAAPECVCVIYKSPGNDEKPAYYLQVYNLEGKYLFEERLPFNPQGNIWMDKDNLTFYTFSNNQGSGITLLNYKINPENQEH